MRIRFTRRSLTVTFYLAVTVLTASRTLLAQSNVSVLAFGAVADGVMRKDGAMAPNSPVLTSASGSFTAADQGKYIQVIGAGPGGTARTDGVISSGSAVLTSGSSGFVSSDVGRCIVVSGAGTGGGNLVGRIQSFNSPSSVTLTVSAQTSVSGVFFNYGGMTLEATIQSVQSASAVTLSAPASALISAATYAYGTDNHAAFQRAVDTVGVSGGGQVNVPAPSNCAGGAVCGYVVKASDQQTAQAPGAIKIRYNNVSLVGDAPQTNLFCRGAFGTYSNTVAFPGTTGNIRGFCLTIGDNGGPNGAAGEAVSNVTISQLHLYGMTNGNTFNVNFAYPPTTPTGDGWDVTHKAIYMWDNSAFSNIVFNSIVIQDFKAENIYSGGSVVTGMIIRNSTITNFNGNGISMLAADLQVLNNTISNGSNAAVENSTVSMGGQALVRQIYQGNTISLMPREGIVVVGVDNGVAAGTVQILNNTFDTIAQTNPSGTESAIYIASQGNFIPPANVTVTGNTCHDCQTFGVFQTSGNTLIQANNFIVDRYNAGSVFSFTNALNNVTITNNTGSSTAQAQASNFNVGAVYVLNPGFANGSFPWKNVIVKGNSWNFPGAPQYQFVTTSGPGWNLLTQDNLRWQGDVCNGCTHADVNHGLVNLASTTTIRPYGPVVYVNGNTSAVNATVDASKEEDGSQVQIFNAGTNPVSFSSDNNLSLPSTYSLQPGSSLNLLYSAAAGRFTLANAPSSVSVSSTAGTPQSVTVNKTFSAALQATVKDSSNAPLSGVAVTFSAPSSGPSATFSGSASTVAITGSNGVATAPAPTANGQAGAYVVTATVAGAVNSASFFLTNTPAVVSGNGTLTGTGTSSAAAVNLTAEGGSDWVHWGDSSIPTRKAGVTAQLSSYTLIGSGTVLTYSDDPRPASWTDGTPLLSATNNLNGIYVAAPGQGLSFTAPADTTSHTLTVHVGGWFSAGTFTAHLSDGSAADFTDVTAVANGQYDRNYTLVYQAGAAGQSLTVSWVMTAGASYGNVTLNAAALAGAAAPAVTITSTAGTPQSATVGAAFGAALQATVKDSNNNPVSGISVTFAAPASGASGTFGGSSSVVALTGSTGIATAPTLTANSQAGGYLVVASVAGATSSALFSLTNTAPATISISATGGTPQSATIGAPFGAALQATVKDSNNNPVSGATVTFAAATSGASGTFGGSVTVTAVTGTTGIATAPTFTANSQTGGYLVVATVPNGASSALFSLTNTAAVTISVSATGGTPQSTTAGTSFPTPLQATVKDSNNNPVSGATVTFAAPTGGATGTFSGSVSVTAVTGTTGIATAPTFTANGQPGGYLVVATVANGTSGALFSLTNTAAVTISISATGGTPQGTTVGSNFATPLQATVKDSNNNPVSGATVTFAASASGPSGTFGGSATVTAVTGTTGIATAPAFTANSQTGTYLVIATVANGTSSAMFNLTNTAAVTISVSATGGTPQNAVVGTAFATSLQATVKDSNNNPVSGVTVTFAAPTSGASGTFAGSATVTAVTGPTGIATAPIFTANSQTGTYLVTATVTNGTSSAPFSLTNTAPLTISISATGGTPQSANIGTAFATFLQATVKDSNNNPLSGVTVTFAAPTSGASGTFNGPATVAATTGTGGIATPPTFYANSQAGNYLVVATIANGASAAFSLTNMGPVTISVSATGGTPQGTTTGTTFATPLQATVKDSNNNPVSGATVTFAAPTGGASGTFAGSASVNAITGTTGIASAPAFTANNQIGSYLVVATVANGTSSALFSLTNTASVAISVSASGGTPQSTTTGTTFAAPLQATVKDSNNNPVSGATVTFAAPTGGASGTFAGSASVTAITGTTGIASAPAFTANSQTGGYLVVATVANGASSALFSLTNTASVTISVSATGGTPQSATVGTTFATPLQATVKDSNNNPVSGATVTFATPTGGASGTFGGSSSVTAITGTTGIASAPAFTANSQTGSYVIVATVANGTSSALFSLTNTAAALTISVSATGGTPQSATVGTTFTSPLQATVKDSNNNPVSGATVTFATPATGPGATFSGSSSATAVTGPTGVATAPALTANNQAGSYAVVATVSGATAGATFTLTNTAASAPPGNGSLTGVGTSSTTPVNLTAEGTGDWVHWGDSGLSRKAGVSPQLSSYTLVGGGSALVYNNDPRAVNWTDGTPATSASNNTNGLYISGTGQGFAITAPADTTVRTLTVHVGGWQSGGTLAAHLSDNSAADFADVTAAVSGQYDRNYTLTYHAGSAGQTITVFWAMSSGAGNVTVNAAAVSGSPISGPPPQVGSLTAIADSSSAAVNLTSEGIADWIHWGDGALNRKNGVTPLLSNYSVIGGGVVNGYSNDPRPVMWTDGSPASAGANNTDGLYINAVGNGFAFTAPADTTVRTLTIHVGGWFSGGTLTAHLSDGSAADFMDTTPPVSNAFDRNYTVTYNAASAGQTLTIGWVDTASGGNVTLNGAALR